AATAIHGCAHTFIEGTQIKDTEDSRALLAVLDIVRAAMEARDPEAILAVVSKDYFEDSGTLDAADDYGYQELSTKILPESLAATKEIHVTFQIYEIVVADDRAHADIRYASRTHIMLPAGPLWDTHREFNRVEFAREDGAWRIVSGL
ncbi:MAG: hypothetical protein V3T05_06025, partial [Myxococcota bacterium]